MLHLYSSSHESRLFIGVAGWAYPEWQNLLGVASEPRPHAVLAILCELFNLVEITSSYYHPPDARTAKAWLEAAPSGRPFYFTMRLWNKLVRERTLLLQNDIRLMKAGLSPVHEAGKLGAVIVPVLSTMHYSESNELWLLGLLDTFAEFPLVVENLHPSWFKSDTLLRLQDRNIGVVELDKQNETNHGGTPKLSPKRVVYLRCRGRYDNISSNSFAERDTRVDYVYSETEIAKLALKLKNALPYLATGFVVFNNHPRGNALANALELEFALSSERLNPPQALLQSFPALQKLTPALLKQRDLFEERI